MIEKIGILLPYSGEFADLKRVFLNPFVTYAKSNGIELFKEFIGKGSEKDVNAAVDKLFYQEDVDVIIAYAGYRVVTNLFECLRRNPSKSFIHISLGEVIPYTHSRINYPPNYLLFSSNAWRSIAFLGNWVAQKLPARQCLICTSLYDSGYSLNEAFRIGYHSENAKSLRLCTLKNAPDVIQVDGLFEEIEHFRPEHIHVTLCGKELDLFLARFDRAVQYQPSVSFSFPVAINEISAAHASLVNAYSAFPTRAMPQHIDDLVINPFASLFNDLVAQTIQWLDGKTLVTDESISILELNLVHKKVIDLNIIGNLSHHLNADFNHSAEQAIALWQNPYLCI